jgi:hypothetical protein
MKTIIVSALFAAFSLPVAAGEIVEFDDHFVSMRSRAEVQAEVAKAAAAGELDTAGEITSYPNMASVPSTRSRAEVKAELARAAAAGELNTQGEITWIPPVHSGSGPARLASGRLGSSN